MQSRCRMYEAQDLCGYGSGYKYCLSSPDFQGIRQRHLLSFHHVPFFTNPYFRSLFHFDHCRIFIFSCETSSDPTRRQISLRQRLAAGWKRC